MALTTACEIRRRHGKTKPCTWQSSRAVAVVEAPDKEALLTFKIFCRAEKSKPPMPGIPGMPAGAPPALSPAIVHRLCVPERMKCRDQLELAACLGSLVWSTLCVSRNIRKSSMEYAVRANLTHQTASATAAQDYTLMLAGHVGCHRVISKRRPLSGTIDAHRPQGCIAVCCKAVRPAVMNVHQRPHQTPLEFNATGSPPPLTTEVRCNSLRARCDRCDRG